MDLETRKSALRTEVRARLPKGAALVDASVRAQERLAQWDVCRAARVVALYRALPTECGTAALAAALQAAGKEVCYPAVAPDERALSFRRSFGPFVRGALGIEEPTGAPVALEEIDLMVVPALAVDLHGRRLGRGRGHYDATLASLRGVPVALVFEIQLVPEVPAGEHDRRVAAICTEERLHRP